MKGAEVEAKILKAEGVEFVSLFPDQELANAVAGEGIRTKWPDKRGWPLTSLMATVAC